MAKDLHWFKFFISEYMAGDIIFCSDAAQGVFIRLCCFYWARECNLNRSQAEKYLQQSASHLGELIDNGIVKVNGEALNINFLDEQKATWHELSSIKSQAGKSGGRGNKKSTAKADAKHMLSETKADDKANVKQNESRPESKTKAEHKAKQSYREGDKTSTPERAENVVLPSVLNRQPTTAQTSPGLAFGVPSSNPKTIKIWEDFFEEIKEYQFQKNEISEMTDHIHYIDDDKVEAAYLQFRRKWKTEEGKKKKPRAKEIIDLLYTYTLLDADT